MTNLAVSRPFGKPAMFSWCTMTIALIALIGCTHRPPRPDPLPEQADTVGTESEPEAQQMRRRMRRPFADNLLGEGGVILDVPPSEEGRSPFPIKTILVISRTGSSITLRWHDRSEVEDGTRIRRRQGNSGWQEVANLGPMDGFNDFTDTGLSPDTLFCYQFIAFNEHGESFSPQRCAYTRGAESRAVFRAQLVVTTADVSGAGTNDRVRVRLNSPPSIYTPSGNVTVVDYGQDDFERGDRFVYDLELNRLTNLEDVTLLNVAKEGSNGWCIEDLSLLINNRVVYAETFGATADSCLMLDDSGGHMTMHTIGHGALRAHTGWQAFVQTFPLAFDREEIESRIEGMVGNLIAGDARVTWGDRNGRAWVEATPKNRETVHIDLDLEGETWWVNPSIDIDFDIIFRFTLRDGQWELDITTANLEADVDFDWFTETLSFILPCGPVASIVKDEGIPDCISALEDHIEGEIRRGWQPIAHHFVAGTPCPPGQHPEVTVNEFGGELSSVSFACVEDDPGPPDVPRLLGIPGNAEPAIALHPDRSHHPECRICPTKAP